MQNIRTEIECMARDALPRVYANKIRILFTSHYSTSLGERKGVSLRAGNKTILSTVSPETLGSLRLMCASVRLMRDRIESFGTCPVCEETERAARYTKVGVLAGYRNNCDLCGIFGKVPEEVAAAIRLAEVLNYSDVSELWEDDATLYNGVAQYIVVNGTYIPRMTKLANIVNRHAPEIMAGTRR